MEKEAEPEHPDTDLSNNDEGVFAPTKSSLTHPADDIAASRNGQGDGL
jgi:hypothetical protein